MTELKKCKLCGSPAYGLGTEVGSTNEQCKIHPFLIPMQVWNWLNDDQAEKLELVTNELSAMYATAAKMCTCGVMDGIFCHECQFAQTKDCISHGTYELSKKYEEAGHVLETN